MILYICASTGKNLELANNLLEIGRSIFTESKLINLVELDLPLYSTTQEEKTGVPNSVKELASLMNKAQAFVFIAPEYNGSTPPVFNNTLAWISRSSKEDWRSAFNGKLAAIATHSGGGGDKVLNNMRGQLQHLGTTVIARQLLTHYTKALNPDSAKDVLTQLNQLTK